MNADSFECSFCGARHDLVRDRRMLESGTHRWWSGHHRAPKTAPDYLVLVRAFRYHPNHAKEVVRQLAAQVPNQERVAA